MLVRITDDVWVEAKHVIAVQTTHTQVDQKTTPAVLIQCRDGVRHIVVGVPIATVVQVLNGGPKHEGHS